MTEKVFSVPFNALLGYIGTATSQWMLWRYMYALLNIDLWLMACNNFHCLFLQIFSLF